MTKQLLQYTEQTKEWLDNTDLKEANILKQSQSALKGKPINHKEEQPAVQEKLVPDRLTKTVISKRDESMERIPRDITVQAIREFAENAGVTIPLKTEEDIEILSAFFGDMEDSLSNAFVNGKEVDEPLFDKIVSAHNDLNLPDEEDFIDIIKLNKRLLK